LICTLRLSTRPSMRVPASSSSKSADCSYHPKRYSAYITHIDY
jgi:hypothetical protein